MEPKLLILLLFFTSLTTLADIDWKQFKQEWSSPLYTEQARPILITGTSATALVVIMRESTFDKIQEDMAEDEPMGDLAVFGDYMGQLIPNLLYMGGMYYKKDYKRSTFMFKSTLYSGLTTGILKRVVNQKRPHGGDRLSFPSGHTTTAFAFATVVALEHEKHWGVLAYAMATIVGASRMNDNAHYLHDVIFGATIGISYAVSLHNLESKGNEATNSSWNIIPVNEGLAGYFTYHY